MSDKSILDVLADLLQNPNRRVWLTGMCAAFLAGGSLMVAYNGYVSAIQDATTKKEQSNLQQRIEELKALLATVSRDEIGKKPNVQIKSRVIGDEAVKELPQSYNLFKTSRVYLPATLQSRWKHSTITELEFNGLIYDKPREVNEIIRRTEEHTKIDYWTSGDITQVKCASKSPELSSAFNLRPYVGGVPGVGLE